MQALNIQIADDPDEAPDYRIGGWQGVTLTAAVVVARGTAEGNPTVDLQLTGPNGEKLVTMVTGHLVETLAGIAQAVRERTSTH